MAHDADDVAKVLDYGRRSGIAGRLPRRRHQPQRPGPERRHPRRRPPPLRRRRGRGEGELARVKPGTVLGHANRVLAPHGRKLGPDPASTDIATVGGVIANNSGGMRCGTTKDSYSTVRSLTFVLPSGTTIDTAAPDAAERFAEAEPELVAGLEAIRDEIRADEELASASAASSRSRTRPATGSAPSSTPTSRWRSSAASWSAPRAPSASSPRRSSRPCRCPPARPPPGSTSPASTRRSPRSATWSRPAPPRSS